MIFVFTTIIILLRTCFHRWTPRLLFIWQVPSQVLTSPPAPPGSRVSPTWIQGEGRITLNGEPLIINDLILE